MSYEQLGYKPPIELRIMLSYVGLEFRGGWIIVCVLVYVPVSGVHLVSVPSAVPQHPALDYWITDDHHNLNTIMTAVNHIVQLYFIFTVHTYTHTTHAYAHYIQ